MRERMMRSFSACSAHISPSIAASICSSVAFIPLVRKLEISAIFSDGFSRSRGVIAKAAFPNTSENTSSSLMLETVRRFCTRFFSSGEIGQLPTIANQILKLANIRRRDKDFGNEAVLKYVRNPLDIPLISFLAPNCFDVFGVSQNSVTGRLQNVANGNSILSK